MAQSLARILLHIIFSTKDRQCLLAPAWRSRLHAYMNGVIQNHECIPICIDGPEDHIHAVLALGRTITVADLMQEMKVATSKWAKSEDPSFAWQAGYGAFSVSESKLAEVVAYVRNQQEHHHHVSFQDEYRQFLQRHGIAFDERYVWD